MTRPLTWARLGFVGVVVAGLLPRLAVVARSADGLVRVVPDDAFYYLGIARHLAALDGSTFDGAHAANGYHPLWMAILVGPARFLGERPILLARVALVIGVALAVVSAVILFAVVRHVTGSEWPGVIAAAWWFLNPQAILNSVNGLETSLATCLFLTVVLLVVRGASPRLLGAGVGLLVLARTDTALYGVVLLLAGAVATPMRHGTRARRLLTSSAVAFVVALPWLAWNVVRFGSPLQSSATAYPDVLHDLWLAEHEGASITGRGIEILRGYAPSGVPHVLGVGRQIGVVLFATVVIVLLARRRALSPATRRTVALLAALAAAATALFVVHVVVRWYPREWYFDQAIAVAACAIGITVAALTSTVWWRGLRSGAHVGIGAVVTVALLAGPLSPWPERLRPGPYPHQVEMLDAARWVRANVAPDEAAAAFNAGIIGAVSRRRVVNLDGVVDVEAHEAVRRRRLLELVRRSGVSVFVDFVPCMPEDYRLVLAAERYALTKEEIATIDRPGIDWRGCTIKAFRVR